MKNTKKQKFFTKKELKRIPTLGENRGKDAMVYVKLVDKEDATEETIYVIEYEPSFEIGYVLADFPTQLYKTLANFKTMKKSNLVRDENFEPTLLSEIEKEVGYVYDESNPYGKRYE